MNDLISRDNLLEKIRERLSRTNEGSICRAILADAEELLLSAPTIEVAQVVHGVNVSELHPVDEFECSECGVILEGYSQVIIDDHDNDRSNSEYEFLFCPNCGAKMDLTK